MGFRRNKVIVLEFADDDLKGLEIRARSASVSGILGILDIATLLDTRGRKLGAEEIKQVDTLFRVLAGCPAGCERSHEELAEVGLGHYENRLISWNLETDGGEPVPADYVGFLSQDFDFALSVALAWLEGVVGTPAPLPDSSSDGGPPPGVSIPMDTLSPALPN